METATSSWPRNTQTAPERQAVSVRSDNHRWHGERNRSAGLDVTIMGTPPPPGERLASMSAMA